MGFTNKALGEITFEIKNCRLFISVDVYLWNVYARDKKSNNCPSDEGSQSRK